MLRAGAEYWWWKLNAIAEDQVVDLYSLYLRIFNTVQVSGKSKNQLSYALYLKSSNLWLFNHPSSIFLNRYQQLNRVSFWVFPLWYTTSWGYTSSCTTDSTVKGFTFPLKYQNSVKPWNALTSMFDIYFFLNCVDKRNMKELLKNVANI